LRAPLHAAQIDPGARVRDARIASAVIRRAAKVEEGPGLEQCVVLDGARIEYGARLHRVNVNQNAPIPAHARIGFDSAPDSRNHFITPSGITVVTNPS
jgi:ADP-glucose pyrophosphorylase